MDIYSVEVISANQLRAGAVWHLSPAVWPMLTRARPVLIESGVIMFSVSTSPVSTLQCPLQRKLSPANISTLARHLDTSIVPADVLMTWW